MDRKNQKKIGIFLSYFYFTVKIIAQLAILPIILKGLGQSEYGVYQLSSSIISYLSLLNMGLNGAYLKFYADAKIENREGNLNFTYLVLFAAFAIVSVIAGFAIAENKELIIGNKLTRDELELAELLMKILSINLSVSFISNVFSAIVYAHECFIFERSINLISAILDPILIYVTLILGYRSIGLVIISLLITIIKLITCLIYCFKVIKAPFVISKIDFKYTHSIFVFSFFIFLNSIIDQINWNIDKYLLGRFIGSVSVTIYSIAAQINNIYIVVSDVIASLYAPEVNRFIAAKDKNMVEINNLFIKVSRIQAIIVYGILPAFIILGKDFIKLWVGEMYSEAYYIALFLLVSASMPLCETLAIDIQRAMNLHKYRSIIYSITSLANIFVSILLIPKYGGIGAAAGTAVSLIVGNVVIMNVFYYKRMGLEIGKLFLKVSKIFIPAIASSLCVILIKRFIPCDSWMNFLIMGIIYIIIFLIIVLTIYLDKNEKEAFILIK